MDHTGIARLLLATLCGLQAAGTAAADLNRTHARHPGWLGHARFHVVWQIATQILLAAIEMCLVLIQGRLPALRFYLAALLAGAPMLAFFVALLARRWYGGTLSDPGGIPPLTITLWGKPRKVDMNTVIEGTRSGNAMG